jgi:ABC-type molybdate transport system substrate-binding protein
VEEPVAGLSGVHFSLISHQAANNIRRKFMEQVELVVRASMGSISAWNELAPAFTESNGQKVIVTQETASTLDQALASNAPTDLIALYGDPMDRIVRQGRGSRRNQHDFRARSGRPLRQVWRAVA